MILRQLAKKPDGRYHPARAFAAALAEAVHQGVPVDARPTIYGAPVAPSEPAPGYLVSASGREREPVGAVAAGAARAEPTIAAPASSRRRWLAPMAGLMLVAWMIGYASASNVSPRNLVADLSGVFESRRASGTASNVATAVAPTATATSLPLPTPTTLPPTAVPTAVRPTATPETALVVPAPDPGPPLERRADETIAQVVALIENQTDQNADLAVEKLDRLHPDLDPVSEKRPVVEEVIRT